MGQKIKENKVSAVFVLVEDEELEKGMSMGLLDWYRAQGCEVFQTPIVDFSLPKFEVEDGDINKITERLEDGKNCLVHCWGGSGRTGRGGFFWRRCFEITREGFLRCWGRRFWFYLNIWNIGI